MAALTDAMKWYNLGGLKAARLKYLFKVEFYSSKYPSLPTRLIFDSVRTVELPKFSIETEIVNAWNVRQPVPTKINFEPVSMTFTDTVDNRFQKFITEYMNIVSGSFQKTDKSLRKSFDGFGLKSLPANADSPLDKIVITRPTVAKEELGFLPKIEKTIPLETFISTDHQFQFHKNSRMHQEY